MHIPVIYSRPFSRKERSRYYTGYILKDLIERKKTVRSIPKVHSHRPVASRRRDLPGDQPRHINQNPIQPLPVVIRPPQGILESQGAFLTPPHAPTLPVLRNFVDFETSMNCKAMSRSTTSTASHVAGLHNRRGTRITQPHKTSSVFRLRGLPPELQRVMGHANLYRQKYASCFLCSRTYDSCPRC